MSDMERPLRRISASKSVRPYWMFSSRRSFLNHCFIFVRADELLPGIESVRRYTGAKIEDQTLQKFETLKNPKFEIYMDKAGKYRYRLKAINGELICTSEDGYASKDSCKKGIASLAKWAAEAEVVKEE